MAFTVNIQIAIATVGNPLRKQIWSTFRIRQPVSNLAHVLLSVFILTASGFIAYNVPATFNLFAFIGGTFSTILSITIPFACYYKLDGPHKGKALAANIIFTILGFSAAMISLFDVLGAIDLTFPTGKKK